MKYFSTFSGIGGFELGMPKDWECVGFSEIDKYAIQVYQKHFPSHRNFGDITKINIDALPDFDLLVGGSPCQDLSIAKKDRKGLGGDRSGLFYNFVEVLQKKKPKYFLLENVNSMPKESKERISGILGVEPIMINAALVSAQNRKRLFWCNWKVEQPKDKGIFLRDILEDGASTEKSYCLPATYYKENIKSLKQRKKKGLMVRIGQIGKGGQGDRIYSVKDFIRKLTPKEFARLQCFPDDWCLDLSNTQQYRCYGNAVNVEVVKHIIKFLTPLKLTPLKIK